MNKPEPIAPNAIITLNAATPAWFDRAIAHPCASRTVDVEDCPVHYLQWESTVPPARERGILFVHGGGAHANWWRFIAPFFAGEYRVAALDLSGMGDSGRRSAYSATLRAHEIRAVLSDAGLGERPFVVGHSFGGYMTLRYGAEFGEEIGGAVIADTPVRRKDDPPPGRAKRVFSHTRTYATLDEAVARFRLLPEQPCENAFLVEFIARHSLRLTEDGWLWKFDPRAMGADRWEEPFDEYMRDLRCRSALIFGEQSALVGPDRAAFMSALMGPASPVVELPQSQHHMMLDQPLAFVAALRAILEGWRRAA